MAPTTTLGRIIDRYEVLLFDAYGVLVHASGAIEGAPELITRLNDSAKPYYILTNDASRLPETAADRLKGFGMAVSPERIITSGSLLKDYFARHRLSGARTVVLGPGDSHRYVEMAGGRIVETGDECDVLVVCDEVGFPFLETIETVITSLFHQLDQQKWVHLVLPNPDLIFPRDEERFGVTSGAIALIIEAALKQRYYNRGDLRFERLGKPHKAIFAEAFNRSGTLDMVMIGDQLETDIRGARAFGIDAVLVATGIAAAVPTAVAEEVRPTFLLPSLNHRDAG